MSRDSPSRIFWAAARKRIRVAAVDAFLAGIAGRELEWLRFRLRDLKKENRLLREKLEEYEPADDRWSSSM